MTITNKKESLLLFFGDVFLFILALWIALAVRYIEIPSYELFLNHLAPFSGLFLVWITIFFIAGLYEKHTVILKSKLPTIILNAQITNSLLAVLFFYLIPYFGITPKTILFIYLGISFFFVLGWRMYGYKLLGTRERENAIIIGSGQEVKELYDEVNNNSRYNLKFISSVDVESMGEIDFQEEILKRLYSEEVSIVVIDLHNEKVEPILPHLYNLIFSKVQFIEMHKVYEDIFDRVPLSLLKYNWFLENISTSPKVVYDALKRLMDMALAFFLFIPSLIIFPFVYIAIKLDDRGVIFSFQHRIGQNNKLIRIIKFRTMTIANDDGKWGKQENKVTRLGKFLRKSRIDELPQLWNVMRGDISLIGPRPEFPEPVQKYTEVIPYYNIRHLIKPGLSGWAQMYHEQHPHHGLDVDETRNKLSYDLYYIKNRSFIVDIKIALRTIKVLLTFVGK